jgi:hypothetical protein
VHHLSWYRKFLLPGPMSLSVNSRRHNDSRPFIHIATAHTSKITSLHHNSHSTLLMFTTLIGISQNQIPFHFSPSSSSLSTPFHAIQDTDSSDFGLHIHSFHPAHIDVSFDLVLSCMVVSHRPHSNVHRPWSFYSSRIPHPHAL